MSFTHVISEQIEQYGFDSILDESNGIKKHYLKGIFGESEIVNRNKRNYPLQVMTEAVNIFQPKLLTKQKVLGELEHPQTSTINRRNACIKILQLHMEGNKMIGKAEVLDKFPNGKILAALIEAEQEMFVSTRALGSVTESNGINMVNEMNLITVDVVDIPSCPTASPEAIYESVNWLYEIKGISAKEAEIMGSIKKNHSAETYKRTSKEVTQQILQGWSKPMGRALLKLKLSL